MWALWQVFIEGPVAQVPGSHIARQLHCILPLLGLLDVLDFHTAMAAARDDVACLAVIR